MYLLLNEKYHQKKREDYNDNIHLILANTVYETHDCFNNKLNVANKLNIVQQKRVVVMALYYLGLSICWHVSVSAIPWELVFMNQR